MLKGSMFNRKLVALTAGLTVLLLIPRILPPFWLFFLVWRMPFAIAALAINLTFGYGGLLSFGHGTLFAIGMYTVAILNYWYEVNSLETMLLAGILFTIIVSLAMGLVCLRGTKIQFTILTLAFQQMLHTFFHKYPLFHAGLPGFQIPILFILKDHVTRIFGFEYVSTGPDSYIRYPYYYVVVFSFMICVGLMWIIVNSPFGKALQAARDNELKAAFLGIRVRRQRLTAFIVSGAFTGFAGALWVPINATAADYMPHWDIGLEFAFYPVLGGSGIFFGPIIGAYAYKLILDFAWASTVFWKLIMGAILVFTIIRTPAGIMGALNRATAYMYNRIWLNTRIVEVKAAPVEPQVVDMLNEEYVVVENRGMGRLRLKGWMVIASTPSGVQKYRYVFPERLGNGHKWTFDPRELILLHTGRGEDRFVSKETGRRPCFHLHLNMDEFIWSNLEGTVQLFDGNGILVDSMEVVEK